jgi:hypothetical protein
LTSNRVQFFCRLKTRILLFSQYRPGLSAEG